MNIADGLKLAETVNYAAHFSTNQPFTGDAHHSREIRREQLCHSNPTFPITLCPVCAS